MKVTHKGKQKLGLEGLSTILNSALFGTTRIYPDVEPDLDEIIESNGLTVADKQILQRMVETEEDLNELFETIKKISAPVSVMRKESDKKHRERMKNVVPLATPFDANQEQSQTTQEETLRGNAKENQGKGKK